MAKNTGQLIIGLDGNIVAKLNGYITATSQYTNYVQVVAPFDDTDSVSINFYLRNARISNYTQYMALQRDASNVPLKGRDVIDSAKEYYQDTKDWNVWIVPIDSLALAAISKWHSGTVDVSVTFRSFRNLEIEETGTYIGTFGSRKSSTKGDIPISATVGDFFKCDYLDYYSDVSELEFTLGDLAIYTETGWIKGIAYETRLSSGSTQFGVDPAIYGQAVEDTRLDTTEMIIDRIAGLEAAVLNTDGGEAFAADSYIRNGVDINYPSIGTSILSDIVYLERGNVGYHTTIENLVKELPEVDATVLRTTGTPSPYSGQGFYASDSVVLIGSATGPGISWDGENIFLRGTIQSGIITDPALIELLTGPAGADGIDGAAGADGYSPILGVDYFNGVNGASFTFKGVLPLLSSLSLISLPSINDAYRITETEELWLWTGAIWKNMGVIRGLPGTDGANGLSSYLHIAYATNATGTTGFSTLTAVGKTYIGTYRDFVSSDSIDPTKYKWALIKGADGADGSDGSDGVNAYLHIAYATASDGSTGFSTTVSTDKTYIGTYTNSTLTDSETATDYDWMLIKGADGADGSDGADGINAYWHIAWATAADGSTGFSTTVSAGKTYVGTYTNSTVTDSEVYTDYDWVLIKGADGANGSDGADGVNAYLHIAYANSSDGQTDFSTTISTDKLYIGTYTNSTLADSETYTDYSWTLIKGADGADGTDGTDGINSYLHIAWATAADGSTGFSTSVSTNKTYIGTYTNSTVTDSEVYTDYDWLLVKGADGADGSDGTNGVNAYWHVAYATAADGSTGFSTSISTNKTYIGTYTNSVITDSEVYTDYDWILIKGSDGANGTDGTDGVSAYLHIAYATAADGSTGFSTTVSTDKTYIGQYTNSTITDSETYTDYSWTKIVGPAGADGSDGLQYYLHIAYATNSTGTTGFSTTVATGKTYIGTYTDTNVADSETPSAYTWVLFKGADGTDGIDGTSVVLKGSVATVALLPSSGNTVGDLYVVEADGDGYVWNGSSWTNAGPIQGPAGTDGTDGADGLNAYVHFAYATSSNGQTDFATSPFTGARYIGTYTDFTLADSTLYSDYTWALFVGADGTNGTDGTDGLASYIHYAYATANDGSTGFSTTYTGSETYVGWYADNTITDSVTYTDYDWSLFKGTDGTNGTDGSDGLAAYVHYAYATSSDGQTNFSTTVFAGASYVGWYTDQTLEDSLVYTDYDWSLFKGADGLDGNDGTDGLSAYIHYAYSTAFDGSSNFSTSPFLGANYVGWLTDFNVADSETYSDYTWSLYKGTDGSDGSNGLSAYIHYAYATSSDGQTSFSTSWFSGATYAGWYTDNTITDSVNYLDYDWSLFKGSDGLDGADGADGLSAYIHYAYATAANGSLGFSANYTGVQNYVGWYTDFTLEDSTDYTDYEWSLFKGADGADGTDGSDGLAAYIHYAYATSSDGLTGFSTSHFVGATYVGWYTDFTVTDSETYTDYDWSLFTGADGLDGADGNDGLNGYVHYAYSTVSDGSTGFSTSYTGTEAYIGWYSDFTLEDSVNYTDYEWSLFRGFDGADGADGSPAKTLKIEGTTVFKYPARPSGWSYPTEERITLRARLSNTTGYHWEYFDNEWNDWQNLPANVWNGTNTYESYVIKYDDPVWTYTDVWNNVVNLNTLQIRCSDTADDVYDIVTITKLYDGQNTLDIIFSDQNILVSTNSAGFGYDLTEISEQITAYYNLQDVTNQVSFSAWIESSQNWGYEPVVNGLTMLLEDNATVNGRYTFSADPGGWVADKTTFTIKSDYGSFSVQHNITVHKTKDGAAGADGTDGVDGTSIVLKGSVNTVGDLPTGATTGDLYVVLADGDGYVWNGSTWDNVGAIRGPAGTDGTDGVDGPAGPGLVYRGLFSSAAVYYANDSRRDVVLYSGTYYALKPLYNNATGLWVLNEWETMTSFSSIATGLLLADNATVNKGLVIGSSAVDTNAFIRTFDMASVDAVSGKGFYLSGNGKFRFGDIQGSNIYWDGSELIMNAPLSATKLTTGTIDASDITINNLDASNITTGTIDASVISVIKLNANQLTTGKISSAAEIATPGTGSYFDLVQNELVIQDSESKMTLEDGQLTIVSESTIVSAPTTWAQWSSQPGLHMLGTAGTIFNEMGLSNQTTLLATIADGNANKGDITEIQLPYPMLKISDYQQVYVMLKMQDSGAWITVTIPGQHLEQTGAVKYHVNEIEGTDTWFEFSINNEPTYTQGTEGWHGSATFTVTDKGAILGGDIDGIQIYGAGQRNDRYVQYIPKGPTLTYFTPTDHLYAKNTCSGPATIKLYTPGVGWQTFDNVNPGASVMTTATASGYCYVYSIYKGIDGSLTDTGWTTYSVYCLV